MSKNFIIKSWILSKSILSIKKSTKLNDKWSQIKNINPSIIKLIKIK